MTGSQDRVSPGTSSGTAAVSEPLRRRYASYRRDQGRALLAMVPRDGLRSLVRASGAVALAREDASLDELAEFCADLLPLPPLLTWARDFQRNREAYLADSPVLEAGPRSPDGTPVAVAVREFVERGRGCVARLLVRPRGNDWEGSIEFSAGAGVRPSLTAPVFMEATVPAIRNRFESFDDRTLSAFLRSTLP